VISPLSTARIAFSASGLIWMNHCVESRGSTTVAAAVALAKSDGVILFADQKPLSLRSASTRSRAALAAKARVLADILIHVRVLVHDINLGQVCGGGRPESHWDPCAGVTFTAPVPNSGCASSSVIIGISRFINGSRTFFP